MTIDEAIKHCEEVAQNNRCQRDDAADYGDVGTASYYQQCADEHLQLAEWLTELKEAKRLLKLAVDDLRYLESHTVDEEESCLISDKGERILCSDCPFNNGGKVSEKCVWNYEAEALKLLGGSENV